MTATDIVRLWLTNDYEIYRHYIDLAETILESTTMYPRADLAAILRADLWDASPDLDSETGTGAFGVYQDLIAHSLRAVDWFEVAETFLEGLDGYPRWRASEVAK